LDDLIGKTPGGDGFDLAIVAAGAPAAARSALSATVKGGQIIILGIFTQEVSLPLSDTVRREIGMSGSYASRWPHYERAISLLKEKQIRADRIVTHRFKLDEAKQAFETAKSKAGCKIEFYA
jgi:threonine dehydrogenase-like Zn-dependent dehydrogenase